MRKGNWGHHSSSRHVSKIYLYEGPGVNTRQMLRNFKEWISFWLPDLTADNGKCLRLYSFWIYPVLNRARVLSGSGLRHASTVGIADDGAHSRRNSMVDAIATMAAWVTCGALLHFLWFNVERESRICTYIRERAAREPDCETIVDRRDYY